MYIVVDIYFRKTVQSSHHCLCTGANLLWWHEVACATLKKPFSVTLVYSKKLALTL